MGSMEPIQQALAALGSMFNQGLGNTLSAPAGTNIAQSDRSAVSDLANAAGRGAQTVGRGLSSGAGAQGVQSPAAQKALGDEAMPTVKADLEKGIPMQHIMEALVQHGMTPANANTLIIKAHMQNQTKGGGSQANPPFDRSR
jgi:hypothetical protein